MKIRIVRRDKKPQFQLHRELNSDLWEDGELKGHIRVALIKIATEFYNSLEVDAPLEDIRFTGSLANFNYTPLSDIDLHLVISFDKVDENGKLVKNYFDAKRGNWNKNHSITVKDHEVEVYVENINEFHQSTGVYSLLNDQWILTPQPVEGEVDLTVGDNKAEALKKEIDDAITLEDNLDHLRRLKEKIRKMRRCGLQERGEFSPENLAFKILRNTGYLNKLSKAITTEYDRQHSLPEEMTLT